METKVKKFSKRLLALFMAVIMGVTCFSGVLSAYAASSDVQYNDQYAEYNDLGWSVLSDEQAATALLDYVDEILADVGPSLELSIGKLINGLNNDIITWNDSNRSIHIYVAVVINKDVLIHLRSVNELIETLESVNDLIGSYSGVIGDAGNLQFGSIVGMRRENTSSCDIIRNILAILQKNSADYNGKDVLGEFLRGGFDLGTLGSVAGLDIYNIVGDLLKAPDGYESNLVYNLVQSILFNNTNWFTDEEKAAYADGSDTFVYDEVLLEKLSTKLLQSINVEVTYPYGTTSSRDRYQEIVAAGGDKSINGYDPKLQYTDDGNVYLFQYEGLESLSLTKSDTLFDFGYRALKLAWNTVLKDTVGTIHVNSDVDRGHGGNFDNVYYYWASENIDWVADINDPEFANNYSRENLEAWANSLVEVTDPETKEVSQIPVYQDYSAESVEQFLDEFVAGTFEYDREAKGDGSWDDINSGQIFGKLRYSPLADFGFNMTTGPINLYFLQTGYSHLDNFFSTQFDSYDSMVAGFNDALVAAVKDIFIDSAVRTNVYGGADYPALNTTGNLTTIDDSAIKTIVTTLVGNALDVLQYTADSTDSTILKAFYDANGEDLTEENLESAMMPLLIACIGNVNLNGFPLSECIHAEDWDKCKDAEAVAFIALREYLSYTIPNNDYDVLVDENPDGSYKATLEGTILPMARDAVAYVMQGYVPVTDKNGNKWEATQAEVESDTTIFDLLNSVIAYYGGEYTFKNSNVTVDTGAMSIGALLGICDKDGKSKITTSNTIWQNIDLVANSLAPVLGTLQYGDSSKEGKFSSEELIYGDIIKGVLNIGDKSIHTSGLYGVSNFLYRLLTIVSAEPIQSQSIVYTIYDLLADFINGLFGARYDGQGWTTVIPERTSENPFDDLMQIRTLAGTSGSDVGAIQKAICNFVEFAGYSTSGPRTYPDSVLRGMLFAVQAINTFMPGTIPSVDTHTLELASAEYTSPTITGCSEGQSYASQLTFLNNSFGINNAFVDGMTSDVEQVSRYYVRINGTNVESSAGTAASVTGYDTSKLIAPGEEVTLTTSSTISGGTTSFMATIYYSVCDEDGTAVYGKGTPEDPYLEAKAYQLLSSEKGWEDIVYPYANDADTGNDGYLNNQLEFAGARYAWDDSQANSTKTVDGYRAASTQKFRDGKFHCDYPEYLVVTTSNLDAIDRYQFRVVRESSGTYSVDGFYCYDETKVYDDNTGSNVTVNVNNAIPVYDKATGDIIKYGKYDILISSTDDNGEVTYYDVNGNVIQYTNNPDLSDEENENLRKRAAYQRNGVTGYTEADLENYTTQFPNYIVSKRDHVAYTLSEALSQNIVAAYHKNQADVYEYLYLKPGNNIAYDTLLGQISCRGPVDGIYLNQGKMANIEAGKSRYTDDLFNYDGSTTIPAGEYPVNLCLYSSKGSGTLNGPLACTLVVGDDSSASSVDSSFEDVATKMANYREADFADAEAYADATDALINALSVKAAPITPESALKLSDDAVLTATTETVATEYGDLAYVPYSSANKDIRPEGMPVTVYADAYTKDINGLTYFFFDEACTMPIYSNTVVTDANVTPVMGVGDVVDYYVDAAGTKLIKGTDENADKYYVKNEPVYEMVWNDGTANGTSPYREYKVGDGAPVQATNGNGDKLYAKVTFVYRNASGEKVNSDFVWTAKFPDTSMQCKTNPVDGSNWEYRGGYTEASDRLSYVQENLDKAIDPTIAEPLFYNISIVRNGMNSNNFDVVSYNNMVDVAKQAEKNYTLSFTYTDSSSVEPQYAENVSFSSFVSDYLDNYDVTILGVERNDVGEIVVSEDSDLVVTSTLSSVQVEEYTDLFEFYTSKVAERGYNGAQLEKEIKCATGGTGYESLTASMSDTEATVTFEAGEPQFGALDETGKLVNEGAVVYEENIWNTYVNALAGAVMIADEANSTYAHSDKAYYQIGQKAEYTCQITDCYSAETALQAAEIALEAATTINVAYNEGGYVTIDGVQADTQKQMAVPEGTTVTLDGVANEGYEFKGFTEDYIVATETEGETVYTLTASGDSMTVTPIFETSAPTGFNVTASLVVAINGNGDTNGNAVNGDYTITLYKQGTEEAVGEPYTFTSSAGANSFTLTAVPAGIYDMVITSNYSFTRTITLEVTNSDVVGGEIPIVACNLSNNDEYINVTDVGVVYQNFTTSNPVCDLNGDGNVNVTDVGIVYSCFSASSDSMPEITIK